MMHHELTGCKVQDAYLFDEQQVRFNLMSDAWIIGNRCVSGDAFEDDSGEVLELLVLDQVVEFFLCH